MTISVNPRGVPPLNAGSPSISRRERQKTGGLLTPFALNVLSNQQRRKEPYVLRFSLCSMGSRGQEKIYRRTWTFLVCDRS